MSICYDSLRIKCVCVYLQISRVFRLSSTNKLTPPNWGIHPKMPGTAHDSRRRDQIRDPREEILLETNFDDDGAVMTRAYSQNNGRMGLTAGPVAPANRRRNQYRSDMSIDRFSEASLHGNRYRGATPVKMCVFVFVFVHAKCLRSIR